jgi:diguanylate cyclase
MATGQDPERSMEFAIVAFEKMKVFHNAATPRNYEVWYNYAKADNGALKDTIDDRLARSGVVSQDDLDEIYEKYFAPAHVSDQISSVGSQMVGEIDEIITVIDDTLNSACKHSESLAGMDSLIESAGDRGALRGVIGRLVQTAKDIERTNQKFETHLLESKREIDQLQKHLEVVRKEILTDPVTTLANRKHFDQMIVRALADASASGAPLSLALTDIDHFKQFNDRYGHLIGDQVLRLVALSLKQTVKGQDLAARFGGEEFAVILPDTALRQATTVGEHIRRAVMGRELIRRTTGEVLGRVTVSIGVASMRPGDTAQSIIERADSCLYAAKRNGRNRVICEADPEYSVGIPTKVA